MGRPAPKRRQKGDILVVEGPGAISERDEFEEHLRKVLNALYDPGVLRASPLVRLLGVEQEHSTASALRRILLRAIESLKPKTRAPPDAKVWRVYQVLRRRYTEQLTQREVASALGLSIRQLQREEKLARQVLADYLWATYGIGSSASALSPLPRHPEDRTTAEGTAAASRALTRAPTRAQELAWVSSSVSAEPVDIDRIIQDVLETLEPLFQSASISVDYTADPEIPRVCLQAPILRQALVNTVSTAIAHSPQQIHLQTHTALPRICILVQAVVQRGIPSRQASADDESVEMAKQLVQLCSGSLTVTARPRHRVFFEARIELEAEEQVTVLVVDDNQDALQLFQRYLSGTRYRFVGAQGAQSGLDRVVEAEPQIIVLDVMMPERDGWSLLGQFREHPGLNSVPVIVCTILPQEQLAQSLGAADFIRKPVSRPQFLAALDRQLALLSRVPC